MCGEGYKNKKALSQRQDIKKSHEEDAKEGTILRLAGCQREWWSEEKRRKREWWAESERDALRKSGSGGCFHSEK